MPASELHFDEQPAIVPAALTAPALGHGFTVGQQLGQVLLGCSPERLPQLGGVNPVQPKLVLAVGHVQHRDGVAVRHPHDAALDLMRTCVRTGDQADKAKRGNPPERVAHYRVQPIGGQGQISTANAASSCELQPEQRRVVAA